MANLIYINPEASSWTWAEANPPWDEKPPVTPLTFHKTLPDYGQTPLHSLPTLAAELGLGYVLLKDESNRFGLPSFKILGASWAVYRVVSERLGRWIGSTRDTPIPLPPLPLEALGSTAKFFGIRLVTATEGNWGRAVACMGKHMGNFPITIFVPSFMPETTRESIRGEGAEVVVVDGNYNDAIAAAQKKAESDLGVGKGMLVMDFGWEGYDHVPEWVVEGFSTMLDESDEQVLERTGGVPATHAIVPVGVGSIAQAVTQHFKSSEHSTSPAKVMAVEPDTVARLKTSLESGTIGTVPTENNIMCGLNCDTTSITAWPVLRAGVDASILVTDAETHQAVLDLGILGIHAGPCGASTLAALRRAVSEKREALGLDRSSVVVLFCTEGAREYETPI